MLEDRVADALEPTLEVVEVRAKVEGGEHARVDRVRRLPLGVGRRQREAPSIETGERGGGFGELSPIALVGAPLIETEVAPARELRAIVRQLFWIQHSHRPRSIDRH